MVYPCNTNMIKQENECAKSPPVLRHEFHNFDVEGKKAVAECCKYIIYIKYKKIAKLARSP